MFLTELRLYVDWFRLAAERSPRPPSAGGSNGLHAFAENLIAGIVYYQDLARHLPDRMRQSFLAGLAAERDEIMRSAGGAGVTTAGGEPADLAVPCGSQDSH